MPSHTKGLLITALGVLILGPDTLFLRLVDESPMMVLFWRGAFMAVGFSLLARWIEKRSLRAQIRGIGQPELLLAALFTTSSFLFVNSVHLTTVAHTLVIISTAPMIAAMIGAWAFKEPISRDSVIAMVMVLAGVSLVVKNQGDANWLGDVYASGTALAMAVSFNLSRQYQALNRFPAMALSGLAFVLIGGMLIKPLAVQAVSIPYLLVLGSISTAAFALLIVGPKYLPAHEVSLMMTLETVLGVLLVWWFLGEQPSTQTLLGGLIVLLTLATYALRRARAAPDSGRDIDA